MQILIIFAELLILYLLTKHLLMIMFTLLATIFHSKRFAITLITIIYLPGTIIHELAHWLIAEVLRVRTGQISFTPQIESESGGHEYNIRLGHVQIAQSDPIRRYLIGFAPVLAGMFFLSLIIWLFQEYSGEFTNDKLIYWGLVAFVGYLLFTISNNMFSSKKDLEGFIFFIPVLVIIGITIYVSGINITLTGNALEIWNQVVNGLTKALGIVIGVNLIILLLNGLLLRGLSNLTRR